MASSIAMSTASSFLKRLHCGSAPKLALSLASHPKLLHSPTSFRSLLHTLITEFPESDSNSDSHSPYEYDYEHAAAGYPKYAFFTYDNPLLKSGNKNLFEMKMDDEAAWLRMDMPGVSKQGLKVWFESYLLKIKGVEAKAEEGSEEQPREYFVAIEITELDSLKKEVTVAEMKDGVFKLVIPKLKLEEEEEDIIDITIA